MKSIKEKAEELFQLETTTIGDHLYISHMKRDAKREGFVKGANYVLDAIIECLPKTSAYNPNEAIDIIIGKIKQLKDEV